MTGTDEGRLRRFAPRDLSADGRALYAAITGGPRGTGPAAFPLTDSHGGLCGPFNAMLLSPPIGVPLQEVGAAIRYRSVLTDRIREMAILAVATCTDSAFERYAHEAVGRTVGLTEDELHALRSKTDPYRPADPDERAALDLVRLLVERRGVDEGSYAAARERLGERALFELATLTGYYCTLAMQMELFRVGPPTGDRVEAGPQSAADPR